MERVLAILTLQQHRIERFVNKQEVNKCHCLPGIPMQRMLKLFRCCNVYWEGRLLKVHGFERKKSDKCDEEA